MRVTLWLNDEFDSAIIVNCYTIEYKKGYIVFYSKEIKNIVYKLNVESMDLFSKNDKYPEFEKETSLVRWFEISDL